TFYANGTVRTEWDSVAAFRGVSEGDVIRYAIAKREPLRSELEAFRDAVLGLGDRTVSMHEGLATLEVAEYILASAAAAGAVRPGGTPSSSRACSRPSLRRQRSGSRRSCARSRKLAATSPC